jgi:hypothetical protein
MTMLSRLLRELLHSPCLFLNLVGVDLLLQLRQWPKYEMSKLMHYPKSQKILKFTLIVDVATKHVLSMALGLTTVFRSLPESDELFFREALLGTLLIVSSLK